MANLVLPSPNNKKSIISWCFYDWANTAFGTVIITFIFGVYFGRENGFLSSLLFVVLPLAYFGLQYQHKALFLYY